MHFLAVEMGLAAGDPAFAFGVEGRLLLRPERGDAGCFAVEKGLVLGKVELAVFDVQVEAPQGEIPADTQQFIGTDRVKTDLVEEA
ncbi:hypothetical protein D3C85_1694930 [compost metagenome]